MNEMKRYAEFDVLRAIALAMILACHFIRNVGFHMLDIPLGCIGNMIFFAMSGWLLGLGWNKKGCPGYGLRFMAHRLLRLAIPLWLFAIPFMLWLGVSGRYPVAIKDVILNLALLNWFDRLPGMTPYWFVTAISVFYVVVMILSKVHFVAKKRTIATCLVVFICVVSQFLLSVLGVRYGYILVMMGMGLVCFLNADAIYAFSHRMASKPFIKFTLVVVLIVLFRFFVQRGILVVGTPLCYWATIPVATVIGFFAFAIMPEGLVKQAIEYFSSISYEVYLVHSAMLLCLRSATKSNLVYLALFLLLSLILGAVLHIFGNRLIHFVEKQK